MIFRSKRDVFVLSEYQFFEEYKFNEEEAETKPNSAVFYREGNYYEAFFTMKEEEQEEQEACICSECSMLIDNTQMIILPVHCWEVFSKDEREKFKGMCCSCASKIMQDKNPPLPVKPVTISGTVSQAFKSLLEENKKLQAKLCAYECTKVQRLYAPQPPSFFDEVTFFNEMAQGSRQQETLQEIKRSLRDKELRAPKLLEYYKDKLKEQKEITAKQAEIISDLEKERDRYCATYGEQHRKVEELECILKPESIKLGGTIRGYKLIWRGGGTF